jgi:hypothetical protein
LDDFCEPVLQRTTFGRVIARWIARPIKSRPKIVLQHGTLEWRREQACLILPDERIQKRERFAMPRPAQQLFRLGTQREIKFLRPEVVPGQLRHRIEDLPQPIPRMRWVRIEDRIVRRTSACVHAHAQGYDSWPSFHHHISGFFASGNSSGAP